MTTTPADDPAASVADFPGRDELESLLGSLVPHGWMTALSEGDESELARLKDLRQSYGNGFLAEWLDHEIAEATERHDWFTALDGRV